jgi:nucleoid DNA-binding protein
MRFRLRQETRTTKTSKTSKKSGADCASLEVFRVVSSFCPRPISPLGSELVHLSGFGFSLDWLPWQCNSAFIPNPPAVIPPKEDKSLNKGDLVAKIAKDAGIPKRQAEIVVNSLIGAIKSSMRKQKVTLVGFGTFSVVKRKARKGRNPQTGAPIKIAARKVPKFTPGKELKEAVQ